MAEEVAIRVNKVSKSFKLPHEKTTSVKSAFIKVFKRKHSYEVQQVLKDVSFEIKKGEFFGIVGRNGSGKSTLLKILAGIYQPTDGNIEISGKLVPFIELGVGFNPELTGRENVYLNGALLGFSRKEIQSMYKDIVDFAELERFMDQKLKNYSSGMQVRLAFSIAICTESDILLLDEVLAVGDADFQRKCFDYFKTLKRDKKTVVFVSHDMNAVREYCDRALLIESGEIKAAGTAQDVAKEYSLLFMDDNKGGEVKESKKPNSKRWGDGRGKMGNVNVSVSANTIVVKAKVKILENIDRLVYGLHIIAHDGKEVTAMNNRMINAPDIVEPKVGSTIEFEWEMQNIFSDGTYSVNLTLIDGSATTIDWLTQAATFIVKRTERSTTPVLPPVKVSSKAEVL